MIIGEWVAIAAYHFHDVSISLAAEPYETQPGPIGIFIVSMARNFPLAAVIGAGLVVVHRNRDKIAPVLGTIYLAALALSVFAGLSSLTHCSGSSDPYLEPTRR